MIAASALRPSSSNVVVGGPVAHVVHAALVVVALTVVFGATTALAGPRVYVTPAQTADPTTARVVDSAVGTAFAKAVPGVELVSADAVAAVTEVAATRQCLADDHASACLSELAGALDVDYLVRVQVASLDDQLVLSMALIDGRSVRVVGQGQATAGARNHAALLRALPGLAREVASAAGLPTSPSPLTRPAVTAGVGLVVAGAGAAVLGVRGWASGAYAEGLLSRNDAALYEQANVPSLVGGLAAAIVGGVAVVGAGVVAGIVVVEGE